MNDFVTFPGEIGTTPSPDASGPSPAPERSLPLASQAALVLMLSVPLSSSSSHAEEFWAPVFTQYSTTHSALTDASVAKKARDHHVMPPTAEQLAAVQTAFGLSKTQLAQVCKVQRQTIYDWYAGNFEAEGNNARRLAALHGVAERFRIEGLRALSSREVSRALSSGRTLLELLSEEEVDGTAVGAIVTQLDEVTVAARSRGAAATRERLGWAPVSKRSADETLESNLDDFIDG